ncbi:hypothetical protein EUX98_g6875 [Antrodiella citrinella]|uniref:Uncharacterized protein n=1 Tax=Antrodiella citrinella TaxID=2447956 RepID=A0A4V3XI00_9APHY|nr:hypothetical protein EUX98_g6875 [Antrodiella citrinella]
MVGFFDSLFQWFSGLFFSKTAEITIVGLQASGKTSFVHVIGSGQWSEDVVPTVAFHFRKVRKGNVTLKIWDLADAVVFVVDSSDKDKFETAQFELHQLLSHPTLRGVPLLVLGNKNDIEGHAPVNELIKALSVHTILSLISTHIVSLWRVADERLPLQCYSCSMKSQHNL